MTLFGNVPPEEMIWIRSGCLLAQVKDGNAAVAGVDQVEGVAGGVHRDRPLAAEPGARAKTARVIEDGEFEQAFIVACEYRELVPVSRVGHHVNCPIAGASRFPGHRQQHRQHRQFRRTRHNGCLLHDIFSSCSSFVRSRTETGFDISASP